MARGWESKDVEAQIEIARQDRLERPAVHDPSEDIRRRQRESLLLSRTRVANDLAAARNPRYATVLTQALAHLDQELSKLE